MAETKRKGARSAKEIPANILLLLNQGEIETANLPEWLVVDQKLLLHSLLRQTGRTQYMQPVVSKIDLLKKQTANTLSEAIGTGLLEQATLAADHAFLSLIAGHKADMVRCWAAYTIGRNPALGIETMLQQIQPLAADTHFGVREIGWMAVRPAVAKHLAKSIEILSRWAVNENEYIRRFATEVTRPRGVWCEHIEALKQNPEPALPILEPLKSDPSKYVRDSVGNWLNDAGKTRPDFVKNICRRWETESTTKETGYIARRALRTIGKLRS